MVIGSENMDEETEKERQWFWVLLVAAFIVGIGMVWAAGSGWSRWKVSAGLVDAEREIGGALIAGALIGGAVLAYEEQAESKRQKEADKREDLRLRRIEDLHNLRLLAEELHDGENFTWRGKIDWFLKDEVSDEQLMDGHEKRSIERHMGMTWLFGSRVVDLAGRTEDQPVIEAVERVAVAIADFANEAENRHGETRQIVQHLATEMLDLGQVVQDAYLARLDPGWELPEPPSVQRG